MPREKLYDRQTDVRTARIFIVAFEGEQTEKLYFEALCDGLRRVRLVSLPAEAGHSAPEQCLQRLNEFAAKSDFQKETTGGGELWLVIDVDRWFDPNRVETTHKVLDECGRRGYQIAISNRCFEVWLLFHFEDLEGLAPNVSNATLKRRLRTHLPGYDKNRVDFEKLRPHVAAAIERAKNADTVPEQRKPLDPGSRIYRLMEALRVVCGERWPY